MRWLPYDRVTIRSVRTVDEVTARLNALVRPFAWPTDLKNLRDMLVAPYRPFTGSMKPNSRFKIRRTIRNRNSFLPVLEGDVRPDISGSRLDVRMRLSYFAAAFLAVWMLIAASIGAIILARAESGEAWFALAPLGFMVFPYVLAQGGFWLEARRARRLLEDIANGPNAVAEIEGAMSLRRE